jgi:hypothetical protein
MTETKSIELSQVAVKQTLFYGNPFTEAAMQKEIH